MFYEQPINERFRTCLRLEHLFQIIRARTRGSSEWDSRAAIGAIIETTELLSRSDVKTELIKELQRLILRLDPLRDNPDVDGRRLQAALQDMQTLVLRLQDSSCLPGRKLRGDELLTSIQNRLSIPGGSCHFDLPGFFHWLNRPSNQRSAQIETWFQDLEVIQSSTEAILHAARETAKISRELAKGGFFQRILDAEQECKLLRLRLPDGSAHYPEISGGRHRFAVRFLEQDSTRSRPVQVDLDVEFELHCCMI